MFKDSRTMKAYLETPLDRLLRKHGMNRNMLAKEIARMEVESSDNNGSSKDLERKFRSCKGELSRYARQEREPSLAMYLLMLDMIGCKSKELLPVLRPNKYMALLKRNELQNYNLRVHFNNEDLVAQGYNFVCSEVNITAIYYDDNLYGTKRFVIKSLQDNLQEIEKLGRYNCVTANNGKVQLGCSNGVDFYETDGVDYSQKFVNVKFKKPLKKGEEIEFTLEISANKLVEEDKTFHYTWIRHPTKYLKMNVKPPNTMEIKRAKVYEHNEKNSYCRRQHTKHMTDLYLGESRNFEWEICSPKCEHIYEIRWQ